MVVWAVVCLWSLMVVGVDGGGGSLAARDKMLLADDGLVIRGVVVTEEYLTL